MTELVSTSGAIAVVGLAGRFPGASDADALWRLLAAGEEGISRFSEQEAAAEGVSPERLADPAWVRAGGVVEGVERFDAAFFGFSPREAELMDPQQRLFLEEAWRALEDAGHAPGRLPGRVGVFAGAGQGSYLLEHVHPSGAGRDFASAYAVTLANDKDFLATRTAFKLDLTGPALTLGTACSTSLVAVCLAATSLAVGDCDMALAGGASLRLPQRAGYPFEEDGILAPDGHCRAFDADARGTVPGSGVAVVVLRRLEDALADGDPVRAVLRGWAVNNDGAAKVGYTAPRAAGQEAVIRDALALAGVEPASVGYVEAHGTGTPLGDPIEVEALNRAYHGAPAGSILLGSVKTNLGHLDAAAGLAGLAKVVLALEHGEVPASLHLARPNPRIDFGAFRVAGRRQPLPAAPGAPPRAAVSSFGIGGTNAHVVLEAAPAPAPRPARESGEAGEDLGPWLFTASAADAAALERVAARLAARLRGAPDLDPGDVAFTLLAGRKPLAHRRAAVARSLAEAAAALAEGPAAGGGAVEDVAPQGTRPVAFLLPGQGAQHGAMAAELYRRQPAVRRALDECAALLAPHLEVPVETVLPLASPVDGEHLRRTDLAQPALFAVGYALARLWRAWGVEPEALLGHSVGELLAACLAGTFSLADAAALVALRGRLMASLPPGAMLAVPLGEVEATALLAEHPELSLAAVNAPGACTISGPAAAVAALAAALDSRGVAARRLHTAHAFHSPDVEAVQEPFREAVAAVARHEPRVPWVSNVTGTWITAAEATDPSYWARHLRAPVRFADGLATLAADPRRALLEVGPGDSLTRLARRHPAARGLVLAASLPHPRETGGEAGTRESETLLAAAGRLWAAGAPVASADLAGVPRRRVRLPGYPFAGPRHWIERAVPHAELQEDGTAAAAGRRDGAARGRIAAEAGSAAAVGNGAAPAGAASDGIVRHADPADWFWLPAWRRTVPAALAPPPADGEGTGTNWLLVGPATAAEPLAAALRAGGRTVEHRADPAAAADVVTGGTGDPPHTVLLLAAGTADGSNPAPESGTAEVAEIPDVAVPASTSSRLAGGEPGSGSASAPARGPASADAASLGEIPAAVGTATAVGSATALLDLARALAGRGGGRLTAVSDHLFEVAGEPVRAPQRAAAAGLARVLPQELAGLACRWVDVAGFDDPALATELAAADAPPRVVLRGGHRFLPVYEPAPAGPAPPPAAAEGEAAAPAHAPTLAPALAFGARWLVAGGLGRFGQRLAAHLATTRGARVLLLDRREPEPEEAESLAALGTVETVAADATDPAAVAQAVSRAVARWGGLDAVVHAADVAADSYRPAAELDGAELARHLEAKVGVLAGLDAGIAAGMGAGLEAASAAGGAAGAPAVRLVTSSLAPVLGGVGLAAFAAADAAAGAWAEARRGAGRGAGEASGAPGGWTVVDWEVWDQPFSAAVSASGLGGQQAALALSAEEVLESVERTVALAARVPGGLARAAVASGDLPARVAQWTATLRPRRAAAAVREGGAPYRPPAAGVEARVAQVWQEVLGVERVGADDDFFLLGGDSLSGLQVLSKLRSELAVELPLQSFFEARTVAGMGEVIAAERRRGEEEERRMAELLAEIESLPDDAVAALLEGEER